MLYLISKVDNSQQILVYTGTLLNLYEIDFPSLLNFLDDIRLIRLRNLDEYGSALKTILPVFILVGSLIFYFTKFKDSKLLRFSLLLGFLFKIISLAYYIISTIVIYDMIPEPTVGVWIFFWLMEIFVLWILHQIITRLNKSDEIIYETHPESESSPFVAKQITRFANHIIDSIFRMMMILLILGYVFTLYRITGQMGSDSFFDNILLPFLIGILAVFIYYFVSELFFSRTPAKFFTNTQVVVKEGKSQVSSTLKRTLARMIPIFDLFSFIIAKKTDGLHDTVSDTYVVQNKQTKILGGWYLLLIPILTVLPFAPDLIEDQMETFRYHSRHDNYEKNKRKRFLDKLEVLEPGDMVHQNGYYFRVESTDKQNIYTIGLEKSKNSSGSIESESNASGGSEFTPTLDRYTFPKDELIEDYDKGYYSVKILSENPAIKDISFSSNYSSGTRGDFTVASQFYFEIFNGPCRLENLNSIQGEFLLEEDDATYSTRLALLLFSKEGQLDDGEFAIQCTLVNENNGKRTTYQVDFTKYGVIDFYEVTD
jgi:hypothetical protein